MTASYDCALVIADLGGGGAQKVLLSLAKHWHDKGKKLALITLSSPESDVHTLAEGMDRFSLNMQRESDSIVGKLLNTVKRIIALRRIFKQLAPRNIVSFVGSTNILTTLAAYGLNSNVIISERNDPARQDLGFPWQQLRPKCYNLADHVTANSRAAVTTLAKWLPQGKLHFTPNPIKLHPLDTTQNIKKEPLLLAIGRLHKQKAYDLLLDAFANSKAIKAGWKLAIVGDGPLRQALKSHAEQLKINDHILWPGHVDDTASWYRRASIFVLASHFEGTPNVFLEAASYSLPCILSSSCHGCFAYVKPGESCETFISGDSKALKKAINKLIDSPQLQDLLGKNARSALEAEQGSGELVWDSLIV